MMDSMRPEQSYCLITGEISIEYSAFESGQFDNGLHQKGTGMEFEILGELFKATVIVESSCDPENEKLTA
jgi:glycine cleavage system aminomethyltransferase T